jgi:hypothetical protein
MHIECPSCSTDNKIEFGENIICYECKKTFAGHSFKKFKKPVLSATAALFIGVFGTYKIDQVFLTDQRYPLNVEYELIVNCVYSSHTLRNSVRNVEKTQLCICALERTMEEISYKQLRKSESEFLTRFRSNIARCN